MSPVYAELRVTSNFSFLRGASQPEELVERAASLGLAAIGIADRNSLAGIVRAHKAAKQAGVRFLPGARLDLADGASLLCYPTDRAAYGRLCRLLTLGRRRAEKGECRLLRADVRNFGAGQVFVALPPDRPEEDFAHELAMLAADFPGAVYLAAEHLARGDDNARIERLADLARASRLPLLATNDVHAHDPTRRPLQDVLTCIREHCTVDTAGFRLHANAERHLKPAPEIARLFRGHEAALAHTIEIVERCHFDLDELRYEYPVDTVPPDRTAQAELESLARAGAAERFPRGVPQSVQMQLAHEFALIGKLNYAPYFLTVHDIVRFARSKGILAQGRGSAANSVVCYCLGITSVDPSRIDVLFERFVSAERNEPPDIDVDFEHERREEVIQYIYQRYGRERAGLAATVIAYRSRSAIREVGKALGLSLDTVGALAGQVWGWGEEALEARAVRDAGLDPREPRLKLALRLAGELAGFPRHLSQHVGGFVITRGRLDEVVPIENAAMPDRTVIQWDKDDIDTLGILKVDVLGLGMLSCLRKGFELISRHHGKSYTLASVPEEDARVYDMLCRGDSLGVFQVESRAQMAMLPRLRPRNFYDLVIEVAIVRPGPIQGDMVHPYLRRRRDEEPVTYPSEELRAVLEKTLGVPLFQEQAMRIAIVGAGFSPSEADQLRRAMATFRKVGTIHTFRNKFIAGMLARGYAQDFAERCFSQIEGFGEYGFPESHAASFALLVYVSSWMKRHHPAVFAAALLNSQPMGFYAPAQIVRDARDHGVELYPVDVNRSDWDCTLEPASCAGGLALRLGLRQVAGLGQEAAERLLAARDNGYPDLVALWRRAGLTPALLGKLAEADAFGSLGLSRRAALWAVRGLGAAPLPLFAAMGEEEQANEPKVALPEPSLGQAVSDDYAALSLSLKAHPLSILRPELARAGARPAAALFELAHGARATVAGIVIVRQRPGTASGVIFMTLEDETGIANIVVWPRMFERYRRTVLTARLVLVAGTLQRDGEVLHLVADRILDRSDLLDRLTLENRPPAAPLVRADEALRPGHDTRGPSPRFPSRDFH
jgi:error-prone DNA polymerase